MFQKTRNIVAKYGRQAAVATGSALATAAAIAQTAPVGEQIKTKVEGSMSQGEMIAGVVVLGLFAIWAVKILWKSK